MQAVHTYYTRTYTSSTKQERVYVDRIVVDSSLMTFYVVNGKIRAGHEYLTTRMVSFLYALQHGYTTIDTAGDVRVSIKSEIENFVSENGSGGGNALAVFIPSCRRSRFAKLLD